MPYLVIDFGPSSSPTSLRFDSKRAAEDALAKVQARTGRTVYLESDRGEQLSVRSDIIVGSRIDEEPPPRAPFIDVKELAKTLGTPLYDGPNAFAAPDIRLAYPRDTVGTNDRVTIWKCRDEPHVQLCIVQYQDNQGWHYSPCSIHRAP